jgi:hypothetical protein
MAVLVALEAEDLEALVALEAEALVEAAHQGDGKMEGKDFIIIIYPLYKIGFFSF